MLYFLAILILLPLLYAGIIYAIQRLAGRWFRRRAVVGLGLLAAVLVIWAGVDLYITCSAEPTFLPPEPGEQGIGTAVHACDGPVGMFAYGAGIISMPLALGCLWLATFHAARRVRDA